MSRSQLGCDFKPRGRAAPKTPHCKSVIADLNTSVHAYDSPTFALETSTAPCQPYIRAFARPFKPCSTPRAHPAMEPRRTPEYVLEVFADPTCVKDIVKGRVSSAG